MHRQLLRILKIAALSILALHSSAFAQNNSSDSLKFVRAFSSADDVKSPSAIATDSAHRIFVADPGASTVHIFDLAHGRYAHLASSTERLRDPVDLAFDARDNLYVVDRISRTVLVYDPVGKYRRTLGAFRGGESYFEGPTGIAIDRAAGRIYICDRAAQLIFVMDLRGKIVRRIGKRGGGDGPGEFRLPSKLALDGSELLVLDSGNKRIQVVDSNGKFLRAIPVGYAGHGVGLAVDSHHNAYITDPSLNQVQVFGPDGHSLRFLDLTSAADGRFTSPSQIWIDAPKTLYVIDSQKNQVGVFELQQ